MKNFKEWYPIQRSKIVSNLMNGLMKEGKGKSLDYHK